jgi:hypothetical protein
MQLERRELRSDDPARAIRIFLARNATEEGLRAAVVSDDAGDLLGGVGDGDLETLAALGSSMTAVRGTARKELCCVAGVEPSELHVVRLGVGTRNFVVTSLGAPLGAVGMLGAALDRILAA